MRGRVRDRLAIDLSKHAMRLGEMVFERGDVGEIPAKTLSPRSLTRHGREFGNDFFAISVVGHDALSAVRCVKRRPGVWRTRPLRMMHRSSVAGNYWQ